MFFPSAKMSRRKKILCTLVFISTFMCIYDWVTYDSNSTEIRRKASGKQLAEPKSSPFHKCNLPKLSPWDPEIVKYFDPKYDPLKDCIPEHEGLTELRHGKLLQKRENITCWGRCLNRKSDWENELGPVHYTSGAHVFECDIVAAYCSENRFWAEPFYAALHSQIVEKKIPQPTSKLAHKQHNVYVIMLDSTSNTQAERNLPKTLSYLRDSMGAVTFPYLNKIGQNSRPNGFALLFGKRLEAQDRTAFGQENLSAEWDSDRTCYRFLDNETSIFDEFRAAGYRTAFIEDYGVSIVNYRECSGWNKPPLDHSMKPLALARTYYPETDVLQKLTGRTRCREDFMYELEYLGKFINSYQDEPKFGWMWDVGVSHDDESGSVHFDKYMHEFLETHRKKLDESFVFFFGDHGLRIGDVAETPIGILEGNNPFLTISVPAELRNNSELMATLRDNSQKLQTHWDTRATLLDILKFQPISNFTNSKYRKIDEEKGSSYLRQMAGSRTCASLSIPIEYCICQFKKETLDSNSELSLKLGQSVVDEVNKHLVDGGVAWKCAKWKLKEVISISAFYPRNQTETYQLMVATEDPNDAVFQAFVTRNSVDSLHVTGIDRKSNYGFRGKCVLPLLEPKCDCQHFIFSVLPKTVFKFFDKLVI